MTADGTREAWLIRAAELLTEELFADEDVPALRVSVGFPGGRANRQKVVGQCWSTVSSSDGINQIFMSPVRGAEDTLHVLGTLAHEMIHAIDNCESGHRGNFARIAKGVGFVPKLTSADNRTSELDEVLKGIAREVGQFPHATLAPSARAADEPKKQGTRMLKVVCEECDYTLRTTQKWIDVGLPTCVCGGFMVTA